jgi:hypothetical protein
MIIDRLKVPPFNTTLMGVVRGVADYYGYEYSDAMLYGATSHAFLINIHEVLCPSGPYCWRPERFDKLLGNLGMARTDLGFYSRETPAAQRQAIEATLRRSLDDGAPCALLNMENQLITGYDDSGFLTTQPWAPHADFPPGHLTWGTWEELGDELHMSFYRFERATPSEPRQTVAAGLDTATDMWRSPTRYTEAPYGVGPQAYETWISAVEAGHGGEHGNWWNGTVWAECRARAADFAREIGQTWLELHDQAEDLATRYETISACLTRASDKEMPAAEKRELLRETRTLEAETIDPLTSLVEALGLPAPGVA